MNALDMLILCARHQSLLDADGNPIVPKKCKECSGEILYNWYRNDYCGACDLRVEYAGQDSKRWDELMWEIRSFLQPALAEEEQIWPRPESTPDTGATP